MKISVNLCACSVLSVFLIFILVAAQEAEFVSFKSEHLICEWRPAWFFQAIGMSNLALLT